ncbi:unnamed protein product [Lepeophtheirus salmonis]|uniref:(salmon louse) hypothetical protein n=1 Tax=Lepeophtheirus salmonis TaxID=72036 RepID=A0A7R8HDF4_LEPSM|nr:unnamed protein product [Lepeophtheirus salmonis]CAF3025348.1 unnamed protein product [Lepeophtheirus salmonis]
MLYLWTGHNEGGVKSYFVDKSHQTETRTSEIFLTTCTNHVLSAGRGDRKEEAGVKIHRRSSLIALIICTNSKDNGSQRHSSRSWITESSSPYDQNYLEIFTKSGSNGLGTSKLCGNNTGKHLYIPSESSKESGKRGYCWNIKITQIDYNSASSTSELKDPDGCLQYFQDRRTLCWISKRIHLNGKPLTGGTCGVNECGVNDCIKSSGGNNDIMSDHLKINSFYNNVSYTPQGSMAKKYKIEHFYCRQGRGPRKLIGNNIEASEIISQTKGPFVLSFFAYEFSSYGNKNRIRICMSFSLDYSLHTSRSEIEIEL